MVRKDVDKLTECAENAWSRKSMWDDQLEDAYDYAMPNRNLYDEDETRGQTKMEKVYDSTAIEATQNFASMLQTKLTPPFEEWFGLKLGPILKGGEDEKELREFLESVSGKVNQVFNIGTFNQAMHEYYLDLATGMAGMLVQEGDSLDRPVRFNTVNRASFAVEEGAYDEIDSIYRKMKLKGRVIKQQWPDADIPKELNRQIEDDPEQTFEFWEITYERPVDEDTPTDTVWYYDVIWKGEEDNNTSRIVEREFESNPWIITRWSKLAGENEGRGPLLNALPDIKTLNKVVELTLKNASLAVSSPYTVANDGVTNPDNIRVRPGALINVARNGGPNGPSIQPLPTSRNFDVGQLMIDDLRMQIKKQMFDQSLPPTDLGTPRSATEISQRVQELQQQIGGSFGRLFKELIVPLIQRVTDILVNKGLIEFPVKVDTLGIRIQVTSPLARGQNLDDLRNLTQFIDLVSQTGGQQAVSMKMKMDDVVEEFADKLGIDSRLIRSDSEQKAMIKQMQNAVRKTQQQQAQQQNGQPQGAPPAQQQPQPTEAP